MKNSFLLLNKDRASLSRLGYDEIYILHLNLVSKFPQSHENDDYNEPIYDCECLVKKNGFSTIEYINFNLISHEVKRGIYKIQEKI